MEEGVCLFLLGAVLLLLAFWHSWPRPSARTRPHPGLATLLAPQRYFPRGFGRYFGDLVRGVAILEELVEDLVLFLQRACVVGG